MSDLASSSFRIPAASRRAHTSLGRTKQETPRDGLKPGHLAVLEHRYTTQNMLKTYFPTWIRTASGYRQLFGAAKPTDVRQFSRAWLRIFFCCLCKSWLDCSHLAPRPLPSCLDWSNNIHQLESGRAEFTSAAMWRCFKHHHKTGDVSPPASTKQKEKLSTEIRLIGHGYTAILSDNQPNKSLATLQTTNHQATPIRLHGTPTTVQP